MEKIQKLALVKKFKDLKEKWSFKMKKMFEEHKFSLATILWNSLLIYLFISFITDDYSYKTMLFSFSTFMLYQILLGDTIDSILKIKNN